MRFPSILKRSSVRILLVCVGTILLAWALSGLINSPPPPPDPTISSIPTIRPLPPSMAQDMAPPSYTYPEYAGRYVPPEAREGYIQSERLWKEEHATDGKTALSIAIEDADQDMVWHILADAMRLPVANLTVTTRTGGPEITIASIDRAILEDGTIVNAIAPVWHLLVLIGLIPAIAFLSYFGIYIYRAVANFVVATVGHWFGRYPMPQDSTGELTPGYMALAHILFAISFCWIWGQTFPDHGGVALLTVVAAMVSMFSLGDMALRASKLVVAVVAASVILTSRILPVHETISDLYGPLGAYTWSIVIAGIVLAPLVLQTANNILRRSVSAYVTVHNTHPLVQNVRLVDRANNWD